MDGGERATKERENRGKVMEGLNVEKPRGESMQRRDVRGGGQGRREDVSRILRGRSETDITNTTIIGLFFASVSLQLQPRK